MSGFKAKADFSAPPSPSDREFTTALNAAELILNGLSSGMAGRVAKQWGQKCSELAEARAQISTRENLIDEYNAELKRLQEHTRKQAEDIMTLGQMAGRAMWQPIETAPKHGEVLLWYPWTLPPRKGAPAGHVFVGRWYFADDGNDRWIEPVDGDDIGNECTHWMPLPEAPK